MITLKKSVVGGAVVALVVVLAGLAATSGAQALVPSSAQPIGTVPSTISGKADTNHLERGAPVPSCGTAGGVEWYTVKAPREAPMLAQLTAARDVDAVLVAYRISNSRRTQLACAQTGPAGHAAVAFYGYPTGSFLIGVGRQEGSPKGEFRLDVRAAEQPEQLPGVSLPSAGVASTVNSVLDRTDAWAVPMTRGTTYRLNLTANGNVRYAIYRPGTTSLHETPALA